MGARGPVPKRSNQRRRRNKESKPTKAKAKTPASKPNRIAPPRVNGQWHSIAKDWYRSLAESGQAQFFEPSDWQAARLVADELSRYLRSKKRSAMMFSYIWTAMGDLLTTEATRRRLKLEIERELPEEDGDQEAAEIAKLDDYRRRAAG